MNSLLEFSPKTGVEVDTIKELKDLILGIMESYSSDVTKQIALLAIMNTPLSGNAIIQDSTFIGGDNK